MKPPTYKSYSKFPSKVSRYQFKGPAVFNWVLIGLKY